jgi:ribulose-bisphosphate carboxylase small chain
MRITQGAFSFLPDLTDAEIEAQLRYALEHGWAISIEHTADPHPRNTYWEMCGQPMFDLEPDRAEVALEHLRACRDANPESYVKVVAYDPAAHRQTTALSFIVQRPSQEPGYRLERTDAHDRVTRYSLHPYATDRPAGRRHLPPTAHDENGGVRG